MTEIEEFINKPGEMIASTVYDLGNCFAYSCYDDGELVTFDENYVEPSPFDDDHANSTERPCLYFTLEKYFNITSEEEKLAVRIMLLRGSPAKLVRTNIAVIEHHDIDSHIRGLESLLTVNDFNSCNNELYEDFIYKATSGLVLSLSYVKNGFHTVLINSQGNSDDSLYGYSVLSKIKSFLEKAKNVKDVDFIQQREGRYSSEKNIIDLVT